MIEAKIAKHEGGEKLEHLESIDEESKQSEMEENI